MHFEAVSAAPLGRGSFAKYLLRGFSRKSLVAFVLLMSVAASVGYHWSDLLDANGTMDWLLAGIWLWLAVLVCWEVRPSQDVWLVLTGLGGGAVIETWGTQTGLWHYFTDERPPLWILPAWPVAALAIDRQARWFGWFLPEGAAPRVYRQAYWLLVGAFTLWMTWFMRPAWDHPATWAVLVVMGGVVVHVGEPREDVALFLAGSLLGVFLEYWGTSRGCWTYYSAEVPPLVAIPAHGFAALAFCRVQRVVSLKFQTLACR
jgi:hypothetical protein